MLAKYVAGSTSRSTGHPQACLLAFDTYSHLIYVVDNWQTQRRAFTCEFSFDYDAANRYDRIGLNLPLVIGKNIFLLPDAKLILQQAFGIQF